MTMWYAERAWLGAAGGLAERVLVTTDGGRIATVETSVDSPAGAIRLPGLVMPGLVNTHSHAFHRALRGRTHSGRGDFWSWRQQMYAVAERLDPDSYHDLARAVYAEMLLAGITTVVEFHYLHHAPGGTRYANPNAMGHALRAAADDTGIRLVLLDTCYLQSDVDGTPLSGPQLRYGDGDGEAWASRAADGPGDGAAIHSVRGCPPEAMRQVAAWAAERDAPLHLHLSEQRRENDACLATFGRTSAQLCADTGVLGPATTAVHATHLTDQDIARLGGSRTGVCFCPTTERDLADGVGPASSLVRAGVTLSLGSDSHAVVDLFEEARAVELDQRLVTGQRGHHTAASLLAAATAGGADAARIPAGEIAAGRLADLIAIRMDSVRLAGAASDDPVAAVVFAATAADVSHVVRGGQLVVSEGVHLTVGDVADALDTAIRSLF